MSFEDEGNERWREIRSEHKKRPYFYQLLGGIISVAILVVLSSGLFIAEPENRGYWANVIVTGIGVVLTIVVLDKRNEWRALQQQKKALTFQLASPSNAFALEAKRLLEQQEWLEEALQYRKFQGANWREITLERRDLRNLDLREAKLEAANLMDSDLRGTNLSEAQLNHARLGGANMTKVNLERAVLENALLTDAIMSGAKLERANLNGAKLIATNLKNANLVDADLRGTELYMADFQGANLTHAQLDGARGLYYRDGEKHLTGVLFDERTILPNSHPYNPDVATMMLLPFFHPDLPDFRVSIFLSPSKVRDEQPTVTVRAHSEHNPRYQMTIYVKIAGKLVSIMWYNGMVYNVVLREHVIKVVGEALHLE